MAACEATTGVTCSSLRNVTLSMAKMLVGSAIASVSAVPCRLIGKTSCILAMEAGTRARASGSISSCESAIDGIPYWRERKPTSSSSKMKRSLRSVEPSSSGCRCSAMAVASWPSVIRPSATSRSPKRCTAGSRARVTQEGNQTERRSPDRKNAGFDRGAEPRLSMGQHYACQIGERREVSGWRCGRARRRW